MRCPKVSLWATALIVSFSDKRETVELPSGDTTRHGLLQLVGQHELGSGIEEVPSSLRCGLIGEAYLEPLDC